MKRPQSPDAVHSSILRWWERRGKAVVMEALQGTKNNIRQDDFRAVYAAHAIYQDAFIVTPPNRRAVLQSFALIHRFWDIQVKHLGSPLYSKNNDALAEADPTTEAIVQVPYTLEQRLKLGTWLPWSTYRGYIQLHLAEQNNCKLEDDTAKNLTSWKDDWKIVKHDDRTLLPWSNEKFSTVVALTDVLGYIPFFQYFRIAHGKIVHMLANHKTEDCNPSNNF